MMTRFIPAVLLTLVAAPLAAQDGPDVPARLTLEQALEIARSRNPAFRKARNQIESAAAVERSRWGAYLPRFGASFSTGGSNSRTVTGEDDFGQPVELAEPITYDGSRTSQSLSASYTLFDGFARANDLEAARAGSAVADAGLDGEAVRIEAEVERRFYDVLGAERVVELEQRLLASAQEQLEATRRLVRVARAKPEDVLGAEVDLANRQLSLEQARGEVRKAKLTLRRWMGVEREIDFDAVGTLPALFDPATLDADALVERALTSSPAVRQLAAQRRQREAEADAARAARWPEINLTAGLNRSVNLSSYAALTEFNPQNRGLSFELNASFNLFSGFQTSAQITQAEVARENADEDLRDARLAAENQVRTALIDLRDASRSVELADRVADLSDRRLGMAQERYRLGSLDFTQLQQLINAAAEAERRAAQARLTFAKAVVTLEERVGEEVRR